MAPVPRHLQPPLRFIPTAYNPWVMRAVHWALPFLLKVRIRPWLPAGIQRIEVTNVDPLVDLYAQFEAGQARFIMAPRHVEVDDPLSGLYLCSRAIAKAAKARGIQLKQPVHTHFIYERGMTIWAGNGLGWLLSRIGGVPMRRGRKPDWVGLKAARKLMLEGVLPMVVAPEGATNGHSERLGPLEPGVAQMGFWCAEDLARSHRSEQVFIVPIGIQYRYVEPNWPKLARLLSHMETKSGLSPSADKFADKSAENLPYSPIEKNCYHRILRLGEHLITKLEAFYSRCYHQKFPEAAPDAVPDGDCSERLHQLLDRALQVSEQFFNLPSKGTFVDRCRQLEEASWSYIYRGDLPDSLSPLDRSLADWAAQEASLREVHMRIVESFVAVDGQYLPENPSFERCAETTLLMSDMLARLGGDMPGRPRLGQRWVSVTVQPAIAVTPRLSDYQQNRRAGRAAVLALTEEIRQSLQATIQTS
ncbi:MAG: glycerol acyltransferase [Phormidesmis priestleyi]|uniref:Glycerol acyltransferase n=1 Tax=Phormidesmis priestleyi TaxID=268141 RepID=A0A2W4XMJ8_9CYAN|nr:MAG: glycerol acyltransferase [Phormidesmis priestleyi]